MPNYDDIRSQEGSRQIIYEEWPSIIKTLNPCLARMLFTSADQAQWLDAHDPDDTLKRDIRTVLTILHETIGHASGRLAKHTFKNGDLLTIQGKTYSIGETIDVTPDNAGELMAGYENTLEELRAEIIAVWVAAHCLEDLVKLGFLDDWYKKIGKEELTRWIISSMVSDGLNRMLSQSDDATEITGHHARANTVIMHTVIDAGGAALVTEKVFIDDRSYDRVAVEITDLEVAKQAILELMQKVQHITSTGDGREARKLIETLGKPIRDINHLKILKNNLKVIAGPIKAQVQLYPFLNPVRDAQGTIVDAVASWPTDIFQAHTCVEQLSHSRS